MKYSLSLLLLLTWSLSLNAQSHGTIDGVFNVSDLGSASYTIPIKIPDGIAGMQPSISLTYNSQGGNGIAGYGWQLSGISAITRIPNNIYNDKNVSGISLSAEDKFALDGSRLILTSGATYGLAGSSYRTEMESFKDINALGTIGTGPMSFTVTDQNGVKYEYGTKAISRPTVQGKVEPYMWLLDKVTDLNGNFIEYTYQYSLGEEPRLAFINYTGNVNTGAQARSIISFNYENRPDKNFSYVGGGKISQLYRLQNLYVQQRDATNTPQTVHSYHLEYSNDINSHLLTVIEKGRELNGIADQLPPTKFTYYNNAPAVEEQQINNIGSVDDYDYVAGDYNGDGKSDLVRYPNTYSQNNNNYQIFLNDGLGFTPGQTGPLPTQFTYSENDKIYRNAFSVINDFNGDGKDDFIYKSSSNEWGNSLPLYRDNYLIMLSDGTGLNAIGKIANFEVGPNGNSQYDIRNTVPFTGDFDGDGKTEILALKGQPVASYSFNNYLIGENYLTPINTVTGPILAPTILQNMPFDAAHLHLEESKFNIIDYDGDGKNEMLSIWKDAQTGINHAQVFRLNVTFDANNKPVVGNPAFILVNDADYPTLEHHILIGDFNGDHISDVLTWKQDEDWKIGYGKGNGQMNDIKPAPVMAQPKLQSPLNTNAYRPVLVADFNNDGKTDIFSYSPVSGQPSPPKVYYSQGDNLFLTETLTGLGNINVSANKYFPGDFNGDGGMDFITKQAGPYYPYRFSFHANEKNHLISSITNGLDARTGIEYMSLTNIDTYSPGSSTYTYPFIKRTMPFKVVSMVTNDNGVNFTGNKVAYSYTGFKYNAHGRGFMGFDETTVYDNYKYVIQKKTFALNTTYAFPWLQNTTITQGGLPSSSKDMQMDVYHYGMKHIYSYVTQTTTNDYTSNTTVNESYTYSLPDNNPLAEANSMITGKPKSITTNKGNGLDITSQTFTYPATVIFNGTSYSDIPAWLYSKTKTITTTNTRQGQLPYTRKQNLGYNSANGLLQSSISDLATSHTIITNNAYNVYGNLTQKKVSATGLAPRTETFQYDATNRFVTKSYNADYPALQTNTIYDMVTGTVSSITQADGLTKNFTYDGLNRVKTTSDNTGSSITITNSLPFLSPYYPSYLARYIVTTASNTGDTSYVFYDRLGRSIRSVSKSFNGQMVFVDESYDVKGQLVSKTNPYFQGSAVQNNTWTYDGLGRITQQSTPSGNNTTFTFATNSNGAFVTATNAAGQSKKTYTDKSGAVIKTEDEGGILEYIYHSNGKTKTSVLNGTIVQQTEYDAFGRQTKRTDPNYGSYQYTYNTFDEVLSQKDPKGTIYNFTYDGLGNMSTKNGPEGVYTYLYNTTGGPNCGKLIQLTSPGGVIHNYSYGIGDKLNYEERIIGNEIFKTQYTYDNYGRAKTKIFPNNTAIEYTYNQNDGNLASIGKPGVTYSTPLGTEAAYLYSIVDKNAFGQITAFGQQSQFSGGVTLSGFKLSTVQSYNIYGLLTQQHTFIQASNISPTVTLRNYQYNFQSSTNNLLQRKDLKYNLKEDFTYDNVNRLNNIQGQNYGPSPYMLAPQTMDYAANGNVTQKSDAGTFAYDQANRVSEIDPYVNIPGIPQDITYTPFDKVATIEEGVNKARFSYWSNEERAKMELLENNVLRKTRYYVNDYEKEVDAITGEIKERCYIYGADDALVSILEKKNGIEKTYYVLTDHLGSITQVLDENGNIVEEKSFDAWGRGRNPQTWAALSPTGTSNGWDRGYTGHEHLYQFGIINMNGRLYDPLMGRMMEPDPLIIGKDNSQGYNRYSYALNNPLKFTDPDGHNPLLAVAIGAGIAAFSYYYNIGSNGNGFRDWNWGNFAFSVGMGAASGYLTYGVGSVVASSVSTSTIGQEALRAVMHGAVGFTMSGMDYKQGLSSMAGSIGGSLASFVPVLQTDVGSMLFSGGMGGASASLSGGNFLKGAISGAMVDLLNRQMHKGANSGGEEDWVRSLRSTLRGLKALFSDQAAKLNIKAPDAAAITLSASLNGLSGIGGSISLGYVGNDFGYYYSWGPQLGSPDISISLGLSATYFTTDTPPVMSSLFGNGRGGGVGIGFLSGGYSQGLDNFGIPNSHSFNMGVTVGHPLGGSIYYSPGTITNGKFIPRLNLGKRF
jgi:RHS repeat-associated protein